MIQYYQANCDLYDHIAVRCHGKCLVLHIISCGSVLSTKPTKRYRVPERTSDILVYLTHLGILPISHIPSWKLVQRGGEKWKKLF